MLLVLIWTSGPASGASLAVTRVTRAAAIATRAIHTAACASASGIVPTTTTLHKDPFDKTTTVTRQTAEEMEAYRRTKGAKDDPMAKFLGE